MEFLTVIKSYMEIGVLGLCAVLTVTIAWLYFKKSQEKSDEKDKRIDKKDDIYVEDKHSLEDKFDKMLDLMQKQNQEYQEQQAKNTEMLMQNIINGVVTHVPSPEENNKLTRVTEEINKDLQEMLIQTNASRASLVQYHNGGKGINRQSFLKMSMTNEQVQLGVKPFISEFKDQFRSVLAYFVKELNDKGYCYIDNFEDIKDKDTSMYEFLRDREIQSKYGIAIKDNNGMVIGFICIEYIDKNKSNRELVDKILKDKQRAFEVLLSL